MLRWRKTLTVVLVGAALLLSACAGTQTPMPKESANTETKEAGGTGPCLQAWTYAPGNFVLDVAGGADVTLMPEVQAFPLYCTPAQAREALAKRMASGELPQGEWAMYRVEGLFHAIAKPQGLGNYILARPAKLVDWEKQGQQAQ